MCGFRLSIFTEIVATRTRVRILFTWELFFWRELFKTFFLFFFWTVSTEHHNFASNIYCRHNVFMQFFKGTPFKCSQERRQLFCHMLFSCYSDNSLSRWELFYKGAWKMSIYKTYTSVMDMWGFSNPFQVELIQRKITNTVSEGCPIKRLRWA